MHKLKREPDSSLDDEDGGILFCKYCEHSVDYVHVDAIKDCLKCKKHCSRKETKIGEAERCMGGSVVGNSRQITLSTLAKSKDTRKSSSFIRSRYYPCAYSTGEDREDQTIFEEVLCT